MRPCSFMRSDKYQLFNFLLDLKTAFLPNWRIFASMNFFVSFISVKFRMLFNKDRTLGQVSNTFNKAKNAVKFRMLFTKIEFHLSNICDLFSHIRSMVN